MGSALTVTHCAFQRVMLHERGSHVDCSICCFYLKLDKLNECVSFKDVLGDAYPNNLPKRLHHCDYEA